MKYSKFNITFMYAFDFGIFVKDSSLDKFRSMRSNNRMFFDVWGSLSRNSIKIGSFIPKTSNSGGDLLQKTKEKVIQNGGKNIFSPVFYDQYMPTLYELKEGINGFDYDKGLTINASTISLDVPDTSKPLFQYENIGLNLFRNGVMSISFSFRDPENSHNVFEANEFILIMQKLQQYLDSFFRKLIFDISEFFVTINKSNYFLKRIKLTTCDLNARDSIIPHGRPFRFLVVNPSDFEGSKVEDCFESGDLTDGSKKELLGILNSAKWFGEYNKNYSDRVICNSLSYKDDELFICDNNAALIVLPDYWRINELTILVNNIKIICELLNAQLIFTHTLNSIIERFVSEYSSTTFNDDITVAIELKNLILELEKTGDITAFIIHGFSLEFLDNLSKEMNLPDRAETIYKKMRLLDEKITLVAQRKISNNQRTIDLLLLLLSFISIFIALTSAIFTIITNHILFPILP